jgi:bacteriorhodopsin
VKDEIKYALYLLGLGVTLVAYAHATFATKSTVEKMDDRVYEIWKVVVKK